MNKGLRNILIIVILLSPVISLAQKTDTIFFYNGDRVICEIQNLTLGKLKMKTVALGTISVEWRKAIEVRSNKNFEFVLSDHSRFYGRIQDVDSMRNATLVFGILVQSVLLEDIVQLTPINNKFWAELNGSLSIGFSYTNGTENLQFNSNGDVTYRTLRAAHTISFNSNVSSNPANSSEKQDAGYRYQLYYKNRIYNALDLRWERNTELGIDSRVISNLSIGYNPIENKANVFSVEIGGSGNNELTTEGSSSNNIEGLLRLKYDLFIFASPKIFINILSETFPSFTLDGRVRSNFDSKISWEIFNDFTFSLSYWFNSDSKPANPDALNFDWGTTTSIGYKF